MFKRTLSLLLVLCMVFTMAPAVFATEGAESLQSDNTATDSVINTEEELSAAVSTGGEVVLGDAITLTEALVIPADVTVTIDLNGKVIGQTKTQTAAYSMIVNNGTLTIKDSEGTGKIQYTDSGNGGEYVSNTILNNGTLTVKNGTIENLSNGTVAQNGYPHAIDTNGKLTVENGAITSASYSAIRIWCTTDDNTSVEINGGIITGSVDLHNVNGNANKGTLTITGGTFNQNGFTEKVVRLVNFGADIDELKIDVKGGTFNGEIGLSGSVKDVNLADVATVYGGKFPADFDVSSYLADGYEAVKNADGTWTVSEKPTANVIEVATKAELDAAIAAANDGDTIKLTADIESSAVIVINKPITLDLGGFKLTTTNGWGGLQLKNGCSVKNGTLLHTGRVNAIRVWDVVSLEDLVIEVTDTTENKTVGGISIQENAAGVDIIKNVTMKGVGLDYGIETYNCGDATEPVIGSMENVNIDAVGTGMLLSAPCGTATNCTIKGGVSGIDMLLKGTYSVSIDLVNCTVEGGEQAVYAHDEQMGYTYVGSMKLTANDDTDFVNANGVYLKEAIASTTTAEIDDIRNYKVTYISNVDKLVAFAEAVNAGNTFKGETVKLTADIDLSSVANWTPIGNGTNYFWGVFDGQDHTVSNVTINVNTPDANQYVGFFGGVRKATLKNFKLTNVNIDVVGAKAYAGAVVGIAHSNSESHTTANINLENIAVDGCVINAESKSGSAYVGGLSGYCYPANMTNISVSNLTINPKATGTTFVGGFVGYMQGQNISNNGNTRAYYKVDGLNMNNLTIKAETVSVLAGGFAGYTYYGYITMKDVKIDGFEADITGTTTSDVCVGGLVGLAHRSDKGHTFTGVEIKDIDFVVDNGMGSNTAVGGAVGYSGSPIAYSDCEVSGTITEKCTTTGAMVGGFVGGTVSWAQSFDNCTADVDIEASNLAGGFVGYNGVTATYTNCEAKGTVEAKTAGGFAASTSNATYTNCSYTGESDIPFLAGYVAQVGTTYYKTLAEAITAANAVEGGATVTLLADATLAEKLTISSNVTINGNNKKITWADGYNGTLINVESGADVTLENLTIDGENTFSFYDDTTTVENGQNWYTRFVNVGEEDKAINDNVIVNAGGLTLDKVTIKGVTIASDGDNGKTANTETGGYYLVYNDDLAIIKSNGGTVVMNDSKIDCNAGLILNAIKAETEINGTGIANNMGAGNKGGIIIANGGTMSITNATINNNKAMARSATILGVINGAEVSFNVDSTMNNNKHIGVGSNTAGAMIVLEGASQFVMNGGSISNNVGGRAGAIASRWVGGNYGQHEDTSIILNAGSIKENTASNDSWNDADIFLRSPATIGEGMNVDGTIVVNATPGELDISGGTFTNFELIVTDGLSAEISGGTFDADPSEWLVDGLVAPKNNEGLYAVEGMIAEIIFSSFGGAETSITYPGYADSLQELVDYYMFCNNANETAIPGFSFGDYTPVLNIVGDLDDADVAYLGSASADYTSKQPMTWTVKLANANDAANIKSADGYVLLRNDDGTLTVTKILASITFEFLGETEYYTYPGYADGGEPILSMHALIDTYLTHVIDGPWFTMYPEDPTITLHSDIALDETLVIDAQKPLGGEYDYNLSFDLNGHTITSTANPAIRIVDDLDVTVKNGSMNTEGYCFILGASDGSSAGNLTIENGTYVGNTTVASVTKGTLTVNGGEFSVNSADSTYLLNCIDKYYNDGTAKIVVKGGSFKDFNPADNEAEIGDHTNFCADGYTATDDGNGNYSIITEIPEVVITDIKDTLKDSDPDLTFALNFTIKDLENLDPDYIEDLMADYGSWYTDYVLTISGLTEESVTFNANGSADGYLAGQYDYSGVNWVSVPFEDVIMKNGESLYIMETAAKLLGQSGLRFTLQEVVGIVQDFDCGVYFTPEFLAANPNLKVTLELKIFTEDENGNIDSEKSVATNEFVNDIVAIIAGDNKQTQYFATLAEAIAAVKNGETITLLADCAETVTITQKADLSFTINGNGKTYTGTINVNGSKRSSGAETLTIKNLNFVLEGDLQSGIFAVKNTYVHNLTVDGCSFTGNDAKRAYGIRLHHSYNITVKNTTGTKLYDLVYGQTAVTGFTAENITVTDSGMGFMMPYGKNMTFKNVNLDVSGAGVGIYNNSVSTATFEDCTIKGSTAIMLVQKSATNGYTLIFNGTNDLTSTDGAKVAVNGKDAVLKVVLNGTGLTADDIDNVVAKIGNTYYNTLANAIADAKTGDTVTLVKDINIANEKLDTLAGKYTTLYRVAGKTITVNMNDMTISGEYTGDNMLVGVFATEADGHLTLTGNGTIDVTATKTVYGLLVNYDETSTMVVENGTYKLDKASDSLIFSDGDECVTVNGGTFELGNIGTGRNGSPWIFNAGGQNTASIIVNGGKFNADILHQYYPFEVMAPKEKALKYDGAKWYEMIDAVAYVCEQHYSGKWYTNEVGFATLAEAAEAATKYVNTSTKAPVEIVLLKDIAVSETVVLENAVLNLNGFTVSANGIKNAPVFRVLGDATVTNGTVDGTTGINCYAFIVGNSTTAGTLNIADGTYKGVTSVISITKGTANISGGSFSTAHDGEGTDYGATYLLNCMDAAAKDGSAKYNVTGGHFYLFNPEENAAENPKVNFCADGYVGVECDEHAYCWTVEEFKPVAVKVNTATEIEYATLEEALNAAVAGDTVKVLVNTAENVLMVPAGVTLDLNGKFVEVEYAVVAFGDIIDTGATVGGIKISNDVAAARTSLLPNNKYMPIYDTTDGCYKFFEYEFISKGSNAFTNSIKYYAALRFENLDAYTVIANSDNCGLNITFNLVLNNSDDSKYVFTYQNETLKQWAASAYTYYSDPNNTKDMALRMTVYGTGNLPGGTTLTMTPSLESDAGVAVNAK